MSSLLMLLQQLLQKQLFLAVLTAGEELPDSTAYALKSGECRVLLCLSAAFVSTAALCAGSYPPDQVGWGGVLMSGVGC
jgi:hypothetical protein